MSKDKYQAYLAYFDKKILTEYKVNTHYYEIIEENSGGFIYNKRKSDGSLENRWYQIRFAYRKLQDNTISVAAWKPDLNKLSPKEQSVWRANELNSPVFSTSDPNFFDWVGIYLSTGGQFPVVKIRPRANIYLQIGLINALTVIILGRKLFKKDKNPELHYPQSENTKSYTSAVKELNNLVNDEMDLKTLRALAKKFGIELTDPDKKLNSLKEILPEDKIEKIHKPLQNCSNKRAKIHGIPSEGTKSYNAFEKFNEDLVNVGDALNELKIWLEEIFQLDSERCLRREEMIDYFPKLQVEDYLKPILEQIKKAEGKTIDNIKFGKEETIPDCHNREGLILHFKDGTSLSIEVCSNAQNVADMYEGLTPSDFHTDLYFSWAPSIKKDS